MKPTDVTLKISRQRGEIFFLVSHALQAGFFSKTDDGRDREGNGEAIFFPWLRNRHRGTRGAMRVRTLEMGASLFFSENTRAPNSGFLVGIPAPNRVSERSMIFFSKYVGRTAFPNGPCWALIL